MSNPIPPEVWERIKVFCDTGRTGSIVLDYKEGHLQSWKITEAGRVHHIDNARERVLD